MTIPENSQNILGYLGYVDRTHFKDTLSVNQGSLQSLPIDAFENVISTELGKEFILGVSSWNFNLFDFFNVEGTPELTFSLDENYSDTGILIPKPLTDRGGGTRANNGIDLVFHTAEYDEFEQLIASYGYYKDYQLADGTWAEGFQMESLLPLTVTEIYHVFDSLSRVGADISNKEFWTQNPGSAYEKIYVMWALANFLDETRARRFLSDGLSMPSSFDEFMEGINGLFTFNDQSKAVNTPITLTPQPADFSSTTIDTREVLESFSFPSFIRDFEEQGNALFEGENLDPYSPEGVAIAWHNYLVRGVFPPDSMPSTIDVYVTNPDNPNFRKLYKQEPIPGYQTGTPLMLPLSEAEKQSFASDMTDAMLADFTSQLQLQSDLLQAIGLDLSDAQVEDLFYRNFETFFRYLTIDATNAASNAGEFPVTDYADFFHQWNLFIGPSAFLSQETGSMSLHTFEKVFEAFYPQGSPEHGKFTVRLREFVEDFLESEEAFNPSLMIDQWFEKMATDFYVRRDLIAELDAAREALLVSNPERGKFLVSMANTIIIKDVLRSLITMIGSLQELTVSQANRLDFYTQYQDKYTELMDQVPVFLKSVNAGGGGLAPQYQGQDGLWSVHSISSDSTEDAKRRSDVNAVSAQYLDNLRSFRTGVADVANQYQTALGQGNQAVNQQTFMATQLLQQWATLTEALFKG